MSLRPVVVRVIARLNVGGPAQHVISLTDGLRVRWPTLLVFGTVSAGEADMLPLARERRLPLHCIPQLGRELSPLKDILVLWRLIRLFRVARPTIVHTHTAKAGTLGRLAALIAGVPVRIHTFHGHVFHGYFGPLKTRLFLLTERLLARWTTRIIAISESQRDELVNRYRIASADCIEVVPIGLDLARFRGVRESGLGADFRREINARADEAVVAMVGRIVPIKNHGLFLQMAAQLSQSGRSCVYAIVGDGPERARIEQLAIELGVSQSVRFLGWRSDLGRVYAGADVVVLTSHNEGTPACLMEALAAGCPVVATDVGGVSDVLDAGRHGTLVRAGDAHALADAIARTLDHSEQSLSIAGRAAPIIVERYGVNRLINDIARLYAQFLPQTSETQATATVSNWEAA